MSRTQPGAVILDQLRDRIVTGLYFGNWQPGERLPSIRDIADAESVDRKTAAAAYHRLEEEGLVEVKARSGVFLRDERLRGGQAGPLERLQRRWLKNTYEGARALGLDTNTVVRLFNAVAEIESSPVPVVEEDEATARTVAEELRECVGVDARPVRLQDVTRSGMFAVSPFVVTTPYYAGRVAAAVPGKPLITATLSLDLLQGLIERSTNGAILVTVPSDWIAGRVEAALRQRVPDMDRISVVVAGSENDMRRLRNEVASLFVWPGCDGVLSQFAGDDCVTPVRLLSEATLDRVRTVVLEAALRRTAAVSRSSGAVFRSASGVAAD